MHQDQFLQNNLMLKTSRLSRSNLIEPMTNSSSTRKVSLLLHVETKEVLYGSSPLGSFADFVKGSYSNEKCRYFIKQSP
ncbi:1836_t:CDS:2, partial [Diversispora eburnea]